MTKIQLQYAIKPKHPSKRVIIVVAGVFCCLLVFILLAPSLEPILRWRVPFVRHQNACLNWLGPTGQVAYCEDPIEAQRLSGGRTTGPGFTTLADSQQNRILGFYSSADVLSDMYYPESGFMMVDQRRAVLFLHGRHAVGGPERLVCVRMDDFFSLRSGLPAIRRSPLITSLECTIVQPGGLRKAPKTLHHFTWSDPMFGEQTPKPTRVFFGTPDPADEAKFSILFQTPTQAHLIEGQLLANDMLQFQIVAARDSISPLPASAHP